MPYAEQSFNLPELKGLSSRQIEAHLKLYAGYVKNTNTILAHIEELKKDSEKNAVELAEIQRRMGFEFNGMRLHELYFEALGGDGSMPADGELSQALAAQYGSLENWASEFKAIGMMRGIGWALLVFDPKAKRFQNIWVSDHELGHLGGLPIIFAMDVWEHAFLLDYLPAERAKYIQAFFENVRWETVTARFASLPSHG